MTRYAWLVALALCFARHATRADDVPLHELSQLDNSTSARPTGDKCYDTIRGVLRDRLSTLKQSASIYHWFRNEPYQTEPPFDPKSPDFMKKIRAMAVSKTRRFEKNEQISTVGGGMYFAADPVSSMRFSGGGADVERVGMVARMDLPPGLRVVRILRSDFLEGPQVKDFALPLGNACPPLKYINLSKPQPEVRDTYQRALKDLNVAAIAYPYYAERYDSPSSNKGVPSRRMGPDRWLAFNVIDSALVEKVSLSAYTAAQIIDPNSSLNEALFYRYFQDFRLKKKVEVSETFRAWADRNLITQRGYDAFFEKTP